MVGILDFMMSDKGQRLGAGLRGLGAGLLAAGAPTVGAPGPNAWGAGLTGMSAAIEKEKAAARALAMDKLKKQLAQQQVEAGTASANAAKRQLEARKALALDPDLPPHIRKAIEAGVLDPSDRYQKGANGLVDTWAGAPLKGQIDYDPKALVKPDGTLTPKGTMAGEDDIRKELKPIREAVSEDYRKIGGLQASLKQGTGQGDIAAINFFQKLIDEGVVRGEDIRVQQQATSLLEQVKVWKAQAQTGELLPGPLRQKMADAAQAVYENNNSANFRTVNSFRGIAERRKLDFRNIWDESLFGTVPGISGLAQPNNPPAAPPPGAPPPPPGFVPAR